MKCFPYFPTGCQRLLVTLVRFSANRPLRRRFPVGRGQGTSTLIVRTGRKGIWCSFPDAYRRAELALVLSRRPYRSISGALNAVFEQIVHQYRERLEFTSIDLTDSCFFFLILFCKLSNIFPILRVRLIKKSLKEKNDGSGCERGIIFEIKSIPSKPIFFI